MNEPLKKYMKVGLIHFMAYPETMKGEGPILETLKKIVTDNYFDIVEVTWIKDKSVREKAAKMIKSGHMSVAYGSQPRMLTTGMNINHLDEEERLAALDSLKEGIDEAYEIGATGFAFLSGTYEEETKEESYQQLVKSTKELCAHAKSKGDMPVILEIFDYDLDKKSIIGPADLARRFAEDITAEYDNFGLMADLSHIPQLHETNMESLVPIKDYIKHIHIGNCVIKEGYEGFGDTHVGFGFDNSENDVDELVDFLKALFEIGYLGEGKRPVVSFEVKPWGDEDPDVVIANAKRTLDEAWIKLEL
ncbi:MAG: TIM barrel protein [Clostridiales bacterium]|nr:TIM barrel protein [Clostridiales bacterium]